MNFDFLKELYRKYGNLGLGLALIALGLSCFVIKGLAFFLIYAAPAAGIIFGILAALDKKPQRAVVLFAVAVLFFFFRIDVRLLLQSAGNVIGTLSLIGGAIISIWTLISLRR